MKKGQIWVETVIYTLIAFSIMGLVLAFVKPKIEEVQDQSIIDQTISLLKDIDNIIKDLGVAGNQRVIEMSINKGELKIDGENDKLVFEIESRSEYSEPGQNVEVGDIIVYTKQVGDIYKVNLTINYENYNLTYANEDKLKTISRASTPYKIKIINKGQDAQSNTIVNTEVIN